MATKPSGPQKQGQKQGIGQAKENGQPWQYFLESAREAYLSVEDQYYSFLDYLEDERNIPVYEKFVEPVETRSIPSFPVAIVSVILAFVMLSGIAWLALAPNTATVTINLVSTGGEPVSEANVTLFVDNAETGARIASRTSDYGGVAVFEKVPLGVTLFVTVVAPDYAEYMQPLAPLSRESPFAQIELESLSSGEASFKVLVRDGSNLPVLGATVTAHTVTGALLDDGVQLTNAFGTAQFSLSTREFLAIDVEKDGYENVYGRIVDASRFLTEAVSLVKKTNTFKARSVKVIAVAANSTGGTVAAEVSLYSVAGSELGKKRTQDGRASFDVPQGTEFYISATATSNDTAAYFEYFSDRLVAEDDLNEFSLIFISKAEANSTNATCGTLRVNLQNESQAPLSGDVYLYLESTNAYVGHKPVQSGTVSFDLCANTTIYASAYSQGYFAANALGLRPGVPALITLRAVTGANNGSAVVTTLDADAKTPVSGAIVSILGSDGRFLAYPKQTTSADGRVRFFGLELGASYYAFADKPSKNAKSALFSIPEAAAAAVTIVFGHSLAKIDVAPVDVLSGQSINAVATAKATGMPSVSCQVRTTNTTFCQLTVYSGIPVTIDVTSSGYEKLVSSPFLLSESESVRYVANMLPSSLKDQFSVKYTGLFNSKGVSVSAVERGAQYDAKFIVNIPTNASGYKAGFILRIGTAGLDNRSATDPREHFVIIPKDYPQVPVNLMSYSYRPSSSCTLDIRNSSNAQNYYKWAYFLLDNASGVREVLARVLVRDNAYIDEKLSVSSAAWYTPTGVAESYLHIPVDSDFGSSNRSATRDWCYAKSDGRNYSVSSGKSYCGTSACISVAFYDSDSKPASQFKGITGRPFYAQVGIELLRAVANPRVVIFSASQKARIYEYNLSTDTQNLSANAGGKVGIDLNLTQFYSNASVLLNMTFSDKADFSAFYVDLYDGNTKLSRAYGYITQGGFGKLRIYAAPERMSVAGSYDLNVSLTDYYSNSAVEDALISLNESLGTTFSGRKYSVLGGSVSDPTQGISGNYRISGVLASEKGSFDIVATHPDYIDARKQITVDGTDFLQIDTSDIEACGEDNPVVIYNGHLLDANISVTASKPGCINVTGFSQVRNGTGASWTDSTSQIIRSGLTYFLPLSYQSQGRITITPASWSKTCTVTFSASARDGSQSTRTIVYSNCAESAYNEFLTVSPSRVSHTSINGKCNRAAVVNVSNTLTGAGTITVQAQAPGLVVETGGSNQSLSSPFVFSVPRGGKVSLRLHPMMQNYSALLAFNSSDGARSANLTIPFDNCPEPTRAAAPDILSYSPKDYAKITTDTVSALVTVDSTAYCRIGPSNVAAKQLPYLLSQKSSSSTSYDYGIDLAYNKGSGTLFAFSTGRNTAYVGCCNPSSKGGECTTSNVPISFDFQYVTPTVTPSPSPSPLPSPTPVCLEKDAACTDYSRCCSKVCSSGKCQGACSPEKPSVSGQAYVGCTSSKPVCNSSNTCVECTSTDTSFCESGETCESGVCTATACTKEGGKPTATSKCCTDLVVGSDGTCEKEVVCKKEGETYTSTEPCCSGLISNSNGKCTKATTCTDDKNCTSGERCDKESGVCVKPPYAGINTIKFDFKTEKFTNNDGTEVSGVTLSVSSVVPVAGFILTLDNAKTEIVKSASFQLTSGAARIGVFFLNGTSVKGSIVVPPSKQVDILVTYPDLRPDSFNGDSWGTNAGFSKDASGNLHFSAADAKLKIMGTFTGGVSEIPFDIIPNVIDTDAYTAGLAVFDNTHKQFLPMDPSSSKKYDAYYEKPYDGESYSMYMFNNNLMLTEFEDNDESGKTQTVRFGFSDSEAASQNPKAPPGYLVYSGFQEKPSGMPVDNNTLYKKLRVMHVFSTTTVMRWFDVDRVNLMTPTGSTSSTAVTHKSMKEKINSALQELINLKVALASKTLYTPITGGVSPVAGETVNVLKALHLGNGNLFGATDDPDTPEVESAGGLDDIFISAVEASTMRILWFQYDAEGLHYEPAKDITGTYEYPVEKDQTVIPNTASAGSDPSPKELSAFPGNKRNTAYFCDASTPADSCPNATVIYTKEAVPTYFKAEGVSSLYVLTGSYSGGASYTNPASGKSELNPQAACPTTRMARNGECVGGSATDACFLTQSGEIVYLFDAKTRAYGWLGSPSVPCTKKCERATPAKDYDCYSCYNGHSCTEDYSKTTTIDVNECETFDMISRKGVCEQTNYNGGSEGNGFSPVALLTPEKRCYPRDYMYYLMVSYCGDPIEAPGCTPCPTMRTYTMTTCVSCSSETQDKAGKSYTGCECECGGNCFCTSKTGYLNTDIRTVDTFLKYCSGQSTIKSTFVPPTPCVQGQCCQSN